ncbi:hypothetical protein ACWEKT_13400 [Nocardia takedensis]
MSVAGAPLDSGLELGWWLVVIVIAGQVASALWQRGRASWTTVRRVLDRIVRTGLWGGVQLFLWGGDVNAEWFPELTTGAATGLICSLVAGGAVSLALALLRARESAVVDRAFAATMYLLAPAVVLGLAQSAREPDPSTVLAVAVVAASPVYRRAIAVALSSGAGLQSNPVPEVTTASASVPATFAPAPRPGTVRKITADIAASPLTVYGDSEVRRIGKLSGYVPSHIVGVTVDGLDESLVLKLFGTGGPAGERNPPRRTRSYREMLTRAASLSVGDHALLDRTTLWPHALVTDDTDPAVTIGVLYRRITAPFLLADGSDAQLGDRLLAEDPVHSGCTRVGTTARAEILLDVIRAHELLHRLELAHGDTSWRNFVYGLESGRGRGQLIDIDGCVDFADPKPLRRTQSGWETAADLRPVDQDRYRVALLTARLGAAEPNWDSRKIPPERTTWFTPELAEACKRGLREQSADTLPDLRAALEHALADVATLARARR